MIIHIVRTNDTIDMIALEYNATIDDIILNNPQITDFKNLAPGVKIRIPVINENVEQILENTEAFIKEYYPVFSLEDISNAKIDDKKINTLEKENKRGIPYPGIVPHKY